LQLLVASPEKIKVSGTVSMTSNVELASKDAIFYSCSRLAARRIPAEV
jgi:hypothetical protein